MLQAPFENYGLQNSRIQFEKGLQGGLRRGGFSNRLQGGLEKGLHGGLEKGVS